jgi:hypothetical protein
LWGSFENPADAKKFASGDPALYEYVIKRVEVVYTEKTFDQSLVRTINERLPELEGFV